VSPDGVDHYPVVLEKMARTHLVEPTLTSADLGAVSCRALVMVGDDHEVRLEHDAVATLAPIRRGGRASGRPGCRRCRGQVRWPLGGKTARTQPSSLVLNIW
jgi:hypothetical protein